MTDLTSKARGGWTLGFVGATMALLLMLAPPAGAQSISGTSASTSGSTGNSGDSDGSRRSSVAIQIDNGTTLKTRFAWNISSDVAIFSTRDTNGTAQHNVDFTVTAPGAYFLTVDTQRTGIVQRNNDAAGCDGAADVGGVTGSQSGGSLTSGSLNLSDPGGIGNGGSTTSIPFNQTASARIDQTSNGAPKAHALDFTWSGSTRSNSCEAAVRIGEGSSVTSCGACEYPGDPSRTQANDGHFATVTLTSLCGNGTVDSAQGEQCDQGGANGSSTSCCTSTCQFRGAGQTCRASVGVCDLTETCTGSAGACPADAKSTAVCRGAAGSCDLAESCDGVGNNCPADVFESAGTECRASAGVCDPAEQCTGSSAGCPADVFEPASTVCRSSAGACDPAESCTGASAACPGDLLQPATTTCRPSAGACDPGENCTGSSPTCPADILEPATTECRGSAGVCDPAENCTGSTPTCPADTLEPASTVCRNSAGVCDPAENCTGSTPTCPADTLEPASTVCRASAGACDPAENCTGASPSCPSNVLEPASTVCRAAAGSCDIAESCTGSGPTCPGDAFEPASTVCRPDAGQCDVAESCTGSGPACPAEQFEPDSTPCDDANACTIDDICVSGACVGDPMTCGDGTVQFACGEECDDGGTDPGDGCSPTCQVEPGLGCTVTPLAGCRPPFTPEKAKIRMLDKTPKVDRNKFQWKWIRGERTTVAEFGDPLTTTNYQLCIYDQTGLIAQATAPAGGVCNTSRPKPCWKATGVKGYLYKDKDLTPDGIQKLKMKEGEDGKAKLQIQTKGANFLMPELDAILQPLIVQVQNSTGLCFESTFSAPPLKQAPEQFKDKAD